MADKLFTVGVRLIADPMSLVRGMKKGGRSVGELNRALSSNKGARQAAANVVRYRAELTALRDEQRRSGKATDAMRRKTVATAKALRGARQEARAYGISMREMGKLGRALQPQQSLIRRAGRGLLGLTGGGIITGGALALGSELFGDRVVTTARERFRLGTVSGYGAGSKERAKFVSTQTRDARETAIKTGLTRSELLGAQYSVLSAGLPREISAQAAKVIGQVSKVTGGVSEQVGESLGIAFNNFASQMSGSDLRKMRDIGDLFTQTQLQYQIRDFGQLGEGFRYAAAAANTYNVGLTDTVALLGQFNTMGLQGSQAGTAFAAMLRNLTKEKTLKGLGFDLVKTADGQLDVIATMRELKRAYGEMSDRVGEDAARQTLSDLFGEEGLRGAAGLLGSLDAAAAGMRRVKEEMGGVTQANFAEWSNTAGAELNKISGAWDSLMASIVGDDGLFVSADTIVSALRTVQDAVEAFSGVANAAADFFFGSDSVSTLGSSMAVTGAGGLDALKKRAMGKWENSNPALASRVLHQSITVNAAAGQDPKEVAKAVLEETERKEESSFAAAP